MFQRKQLKNLKKWYQQSKRKPLILRGARQVGKSSLLKIFAREMNLNLLEINFEISTLESFNESTLDLKKIIRDLELKFKKKINPDEDLLFFDEIQKSSKALLSLRYFYEQKPDLAVVGAGSLLDFLLQEEEINFPVGRVEFLYIGPVHFSEFLAAIKEDFLLEEYYKKNQKISLTAHRLLMDQYRVYCCVGGMPESVQTYVETKDLELIRKTHRTLLQTFKADFLKYAKKHEIFRCDKVFDFIPVNLGRKVKYSEIDSAEKARDLNQAIKTLSYARVIQPVFHSNATQVPLRAFMDERIFKLFFLDIGLSLTHAEEEFKQVLNGESILSGPLAEQFVSQHLAFLDPERESELFYWLRDKTSSKAEVDFIFSRGNQIFPIEVKSNKTSQLKSLHVFMCEHKNIKTALTLSAEPYSEEKLSVKVKMNDGIKPVEFKLVNLPLWSVEKLSEAL